MRGVTDKEYRPLIKKLRRLGCEVHAGKRHAKIIWQGQVITVARAQSATGAA